ncbi:MAG: hypothetical protein JRE16_11075 [Deltaproteobacteria bacterium]|jgi:hypothetical protein|nr:hypothetical protein [Deltaproteobacteria bacterium]MBW2519426.1 hypothetical protein [Deltaproteobacteria bacterium]
MKKYVLALTVFAIGLVIVDYFFGLDVMELLEGFGDFIMNILKGNKD